MIVLKLDMPRKLSRNEKKRISSLSDILGSDHDDIEERIRDEATKRRN